jgi:tRNA-dihydrouridine synthase
MYLGCPQRWALQEGIGAALIEKNSLICEMVKETRKRLNYDQDFTVAVKIRLHENIKYYLTNKTNMFKKNIFFLLKIKSNH